MKRTLLFVLLSLTLSAGQPARAQETDPSSSSGQTKSTILVPYGPYVTQPGAGAGGADISEIEPGFGTYGFLMEDGSPEWRVADDWFVPAGQTWNLSGIRLLAYQVGSPTMGTFTELWAEVWNDDPLNGGTPAIQVPFNLLTSQVWTGVYRVDSANPTDTSRPIIELVSDWTGLPVPPLGPGPGTFWFSCTAKGTTSQAEAPVQVPWDPSDNGRQYQGASGWSAAVDASSGKAQGFLFQIEGTFGNGVSTFCTSRPSSLPNCVPALGAPGDSVSKSGTGGTFLITAEPVPGGPGKFGILIYTRNGLLASPAQTPFGDLCLNLFLRAGAFAAVPGGTPGACDGRYLWDFGHIASVTGQITAGDTLHLQAWYRDPPNPAKANFTEGIGPITIVP